MDTPWSEIRVALKPSDGLLGELSRLPKGTRVGIETLSMKDEEELQRIFGSGVSGRKMETDKQERRYWEVIEKALADAELIPVYLDELEPYKRQAQLLSDIRTLEERLVNEEDARERRDLNRKIYAKQVEVEFDLISPRHGRLMHKILEEKPQVAILGIGHACPLWLDSENGTLKGLRFKAYSAEETPSMDAAARQLMGELEFGYVTRNITRLNDYLDNFIKPNGFIERPEGGERIIAEREMTIRKQRALSSGRVTDRVPDYTGTWDMEIPERGAFEMFIEKRDNGSVSGMMEDIFGRSTFYGTLFDDGGIFFEKIYDKSAIDMGGSSRPVDYHGALADGRKIHGLYFVLGTPIGKFEMWAFDRKDIHDIRRG